MGKQFRGALAAALAMAIVAPSWAVPMSARAEDPAPEIVAAGATPQTIAFDLPVSDIVGSQIDMAASATSGLTVTFHADTPSTCSVDGPILTLLDEGTCSVTASQAGDATWAAADDVQDSMTVNAAPPPPPFDPQPQTITFTLLGSGYVGATVPLTGTASSGLELEYAVVTPATCATDGTTLALDAVGTCTVVASQPGNADDWQPAPHVTASTTVKASPFSSSDSTNLGKYALNAPITSIAIDPKTGTTYVGGMFTQIGVRSGSVALVNPPDQGNADLQAASPDVIGSQLQAFPDNATGYFVAGFIASVNGDGVLRENVTRLTTAGKVDTAWTLKTTCGDGDLPNFARFPVQWDLGDVLVSNVNMASTTTDNSTIGLVFIDKATGIARRTGAGDSSCGAGGRIWPHTPVFGPLASCNGWAVCSATCRRRPIAHRGGWLSRVAPRQEPGARRRLPIPLGQHRRPARPSSSHCAAPAPTPGPRAAPTAIDRHLVSGAIAADPSTRSSPAPAASPTLTPVPAPAGGLLERMLATVQVDAGGAVVDLTPDVTAGSAELDGTADDGDGPGRLLVVVSPSGATTRTNLCLDRDFAQGGTCERERLPDGGLLYRRGLVEFGNTRTIVVAIQRADGSGVLLESDNFTVPRHPCWSPVSRIRHRPSPATTPSSRSTTREPRPGRVDRDGGLHARALLLNTAGSRPPDKRRLLASGDAPTRSRSPARRPRSRAARGRRSRRAGRSRSWPAPGTGKTRVISRRTAYAIGTGVVPPDQVLVVTFTDKAAGEMVERLRTLGLPGRDGPHLPCPCAQPAAVLLAVAGTTASRCPSCSTPRSRSSCRLARQLPGHYRFTPAKDLADEIEWAKVAPDRGARPTRARPCASIRGANRRSRVDLFVGVFADYERAKARAGPHRLRRPARRDRRLLEDDADAAETVRARKRWFSVDEYQDTNPLQQRLLELWLGDRRTCASSATRTRRSTRSPARRPAS